MCDFSDAATYRICNFAVSLKPYMDKSFRISTRREMSMFSISFAEYKKRIEQIRKALIKRRLEALYLSNSTCIFYLTGYSFISTERPAALIIPVDGRITFMGPCLERNHVPLETKIVEDVRTYMDYPGEKHPVQFFGDFMTEMGLSKKRIGIDNRSGVAGMWGYSGPQVVKRLPEAKFVDCSELVPKMRIVKSTEEIELIKESCKWANLSISLLQEFSHEGAWDVAVALEATKEATSIMKKTLGFDYAPKRNVYPINAGFRGQIGEMSAIPHSMSTKRVMKTGDVIIGEVAVDIGGYSCELERTMIIGEPSAKQRRYFEIMKKAQEAAFKEFTPKTKCSEVDKATINVFKRAGVINFVQHHTGHGLGLEGHEPPWLDVGNNELGFGGFRHSDTVLITERGKEVITYYPRDLDSLTIK
jgi:Xaa-Pro aminopeptidase